MRRIAVLLFVAFLVVPASRAVQEQNFNRVRTFDVLHYVMRLDFDRKARIVNGDATVELTPLDNRLE